MATTTELQVGLGVWPVTVPPAKAVPLRRAEIPSVPTAGARELVRAALEKPVGFEPLRRALTPDDRVAVVLDPHLPRAAELLAGVLEHLRSAGVGPAAVTVLTPPGGEQDWIDELPDEFADVTAETHAPADRKKLAYLASTKTGRRVYLNRTLVEADFVILLTGRGYDPLSGYAGAEGAVFPGLGDAEARAGFEGKFSADAPGAEPWPARKEAEEVGWLLGTPFLVQVIPGAGDSVQEVVAGLLDSGAEGVRRHDARWRSSVGSRPDAVIAAVSGEAGHVTFLDLAKAAACAARVVRPSGRVVVLSDAAPPLGAGAELLRQLGDPARTGKRLAKEKPDDWAACFLWCFAANAASLFLASGYPDDVAEELSTTPVHGPPEVQRLIDAAERVLIIPDAHRSMVTVE
jgi:nickel-dependent lactate racemase